MNYWIVKSRILLFLSAFLVIFITNCIPLSGKALNITPVAAFTEDSPVAVALPKASQPSRPATSPSTIHSQAASPTVYLPTIMSEPSPTPVSGGFVADNSVIPYFYDIPESAINSAKAKKVLFYHQSTGGYIQAEGLDCLAGLHNDPLHFPQDCITAAQNPSYYNYDNWNWVLWPEPMADAPAKTDQFVSLVQSQQGDYDIIGFKFCYVDGWNQDFEQYRLKMEALESAYPNKVFIWATSALWGDPGTACNADFNSCQNIQLFNDQLRSYAQSHNKPLYDIASIESNGGTCKVADYAGVLYEGLCPQYYSDGGGHPTIEASIRLAKGFWWLIAKLSGWQ